LAQKGCGVNRICAKSFRAEERAAFAFRCMYWRIIGQMGVGTIENLQRTAGRKAGTPNKTTTALKEAILLSFERLGGAAYLEQVGRQDPKTYCTLLSKILPRNGITTDQTAGVAQLSDAEIRSRVALMLREGLSVEAVSTGESIEAEAVTIKQGKL